MKDNINPSHYRQHAHERIEFTMHMNFNLGNAFKYIWRHKEKNGREDLERRFGTWSGSAMMRRSSKNSKTNVMTS